MANTTTEKTGRGKKVDQKYVNHIEYRLSQSGGTTLREIAATLALRFSEWNNDFAAAANLQKKTETDIAEGRIVGQEQVTQANLKHRQMRKAAEELRSKENRRYLEKVVLPYIIEEYGEGRREIIGEPNSRLVGYGDRIEIDKKAHLHKLW